MALPTLTKTWQFNVNNAIVALGSSLADNRRLLRSIKNAMVGFTTNPWTMRYSCDSVTAGTAGDGVDRWTADANLVWANAGSAHSWAVIRQTGIATNFELLLSCETAAGLGQILTAYISFSAGFTGGTTTARPTATDEQVLISAANWSGVSTDVASRWSVMQSTDGQCTRVIIASAGAATAYWLLEKPANPTTGWSNPSISLMIQNVPVFSTLCAAASTAAKMRNGSTTGNVVFLCEGNNTNLIPADTTFGTVANEIDSSWPMTPIAVASYTVGVRGRHGTLQDLWFGQASIATADTYPNDASNQFVQFGCLIFPWNGGGVNLT
ncbi:MAG TPA: hypothetical protein VLE97_01870 [Gaiellaceae bacterium]|nr:hypothetical protein [Gaiellaceae bacterium]